MTERRCSWCGEPTDLRLVRRFFANNWHAVVQCDECLHQVGGSVSREKAADRLVADVICRGVDVGRAMDAAGWSKPVGARR